MKTRMDKGLSRPEYKAMMKAGNLAVARNEVIAAENTIAARTARGQDTTKAVKALEKAKAELARLEGAAK